MGRLGVAEFQHRTTLALATVLVLCWSASFTLAQDAAGAVSLRKLASFVPVIPTFPYVNCTRKAGAYSFANPAGAPSGRNTFCFSINVRRCSSPCCYVDLKKIEFDVSSRCLVSPAAAPTATLNGAPTAVAPSFYAPKTGPPGATLLRVPQLDLDTFSAQDAELCITLTTNSHGKGCTTLQQLCPSTGGVCQAAFFDTSCNCCSGTTPASPPPSPNPPSPNPPLPNPPSPKPPSPSPKPPSPNPPSPNPPSPSPNPPSPNPPSPSPNPPSPRPPSPYPLPTPILPPGFCSSSSQACIDIGQPAYLNATSPYYDAYSCAEIQARVAEDMNAIAARFGLAMSEPYKADPLKCGKFTTVNVCGTFHQANQSTFNAMADEAQKSLVPGFVSLASGTCNPGMEGKPVVVKTTDGGCFRFMGASNCSRTRTPAPPAAPPAFPNCSCVPKPGTLPFMVDSVYSVGSSRGNLTEYCFDFYSVPWSEVVPSKCASPDDQLAKIEWRAKDSLRGMVKSINMYPAGGPRAKLSPIWDAPGSNVLKATKFAWTQEQTDGGRVCLVLQKPFTPADLCVSNVPAQCNLRIYNSDKGCCPTYPAGPQ